MVFNICHVGFYWYIFVFYKIVIGKSTFIGYNDERKKFYFCEIIIKLQHFR